MFNGYNDGYMGLAFYEKELERAYIMEKNGLETEDDYFNWLESQKEEAQLSQCEDG